MYISNKSISEVGSCDLKTALDSIHLNYNFQPCAHSVMKDSSSSFYVLRLLEVVCNSCLALFTIIVICLSHCRNENRYLFSIRKIRIIVIFVSSYIMFWNAVQYFQNEWCTNNYFFFHLVCWNWCIAIFCRRLRNVSSFSGKDVRKKHRNCEFHFYGSINILFSHFMHLSKHKPHHSVAFKPFNTYIITLFLFHQSV